MGRQAIGGVVAVFMIGIEGSAGFPDDGFGTQFIRDARF